MGICTFQDYLDHSKDAHDHVGMWTFQDQL
jgi:hypothetical protein